MEKLASALFFIISAWPKRVPQPKKETFLMSPASDAGKQFFSSSLVIEEGIVIEP